ncbi:MAG TPA: hypothetical protein PLZ47_03305 [Candidatus Cloacimonas acidaminovorans]|nr:hypothetical protein [Candidatus Cloacimonas acidaminovorans]HOM79096.1 hypothetical protein [Candidatus Cloacimonas acidaminovorans]
MRKPLVKKEKYNPFSAFFPYYIDFEENSNSALRALLKHCLPNTNAIRNG